MVAAYNNIKAANPTTTPPTTTTRPADATMPTMPAADPVIAPEITETVPKPPVDATMTTPPDNTPAMSQTVADVVIDMAGAGTTALESNATVPGNNTMQMSDNDSAGATVSEAEPTQVELSTEQRRFMGMRSVKLLIQVNRGEVTAEEAVRRAENMPVKGKKTTAGSR